jgi:hypothetical protein
VYENYLGKNMKIKREEFLAELILREATRTAIKHLEERKRSRNIAETNLRHYVRHLLEAAEVASYHSTGINVLEDLLKEIIPVLEQSYKQLTTDKKQRDSYRAHIINAVQNSLAPTKAVMSAEEEHVKAEENTIQEAEGDLAVSIGDEKDQDEDTRDVSLSPDMEDAFIDINKDNSDKTAEQENKEESFTIPGEDETGRNFALETFEKIEKQIQSSFTMISDDRDRELFYDYLITNLKLYFDKFEDELQVSLPEPSTDEYEHIKGERPSKVPAPETAEAAKPETKAK